MFSTKSKRRRRLIFIIGAASFFCIANFSYKIETTELVSTITDKIKKLVWAFSAPSTINFKFENIHSQKMQNIIKAKVGGLFKNPPVFTFDPLAVSEQVKLISPIIDKVRFEFERSDAATLKITGKSPLYMVKNYGIVVDKGFVFDFENFPEEIIENLPSLNIYSPKNSKRIETHLHEFLQKHLLEWCVGYQVTYYNQNKIMLEPVKSINSSNISQKILIVADDKIIENEGEKIRKIAKDADLFYKELSSRLKRKSLLQYDLRFSGQIIVS
jgi:hypothetical protein